MLWFIGFFEARTALIDTEVVTEVIAFFIGWHLVCRTLCTHLPLHLCVSGMLFFPRVQEYCLELGQWSLYSVVNIACTPTTVK